MTKEAIDKIILVIGNKTYSSWSLRPWILLKSHRVNFDETIIPLDQKQTGQNIAKYTRSGKVPVLLHGSLVIWESLAIMEYMNDLYPNLALYPHGLAGRALARSLAHEMHAGFSELRNLLSFHAYKNFERPELSQGIQREIHRIQDIWVTALHTWGGPYLNGPKFGILDAMYAPVARRFVQFNIKLDAPCGDYAQKILTEPAFQDWVQAARLETYSAPEHEAHFAQFIPKPTS